MLLTLEIIFQKKEKRSIGKKFIKKGKIYNYLKGKDSLTTKEKRGLKNIERYFKKLNNDLNKIKIYKHNITHDLFKLRNLFNEITKENNYEPIEMKNAFDGSCIEYESRGDNNDNLSLEEYLNIIRQYLRDMINNHKANGEWKVQLVMKIKFISSLDDNEFRVMYTKNVEIISGTETSDAINKLFESFFRRYQEGLQTEMTGSSFTFERVHSLYIMFIK